MGKNFSIVVKGDESNKVSFGSNDCSNSVDFFDINIDENDYNAKFGVTIDDLDIDYVEAWYYEYSENKCEHCDHIINRKDIDRYMRTVSIKKISKDEPLCLNNIKVIDAKTGKKINNITQITINWVVGEEICVNIERRMKGRKKI